MASSSYGDLPYYRTSLTRKRPAAPGAPTEMPPLTVRAPSEAFTRAIGPPDPYPMGYRPDSTSAGPPAPSAPTPGGAGAPDAMATGLARGNYMSLSSPATAPAAPAANPFPDFSAPPRPAGYELGRAARTVYDGGQTVGRTIVDTARSAGGAVADFGRDFARGAGGTQPTVDDVVVPGATRSAVSAPSAPSAAGSLVRGLASQAAGFGTRVLAAAEKGNRPGATSQSGRPLGYGQMIDGVRTFSDGSGTGAIPRTMTDQQIAALNERAQPLVTPGATPEPVLTRAPRATAMPAAIDPGQQARFARSDALSLASQDPRSALGIAARNAALEVQYARGPRAKEQALQRQAALFNGVNGANERGQEAATRAAEANIRAGTDLARAGIDAEAQVESARLTRARQPQTAVTLADGTLAQFGEEGRARQVTGPDGRPVRPPATKDDAATKRSQEIQDALAKSTEKLLELSTNPGQAPTAQQVSAARRQAAQAQGLRIAENKETGEAVYYLNGEWVPL